MIKSDENPLLALELPTRWEVLRNRAEERNLRPAEFVERIDSAASYVDGLLYRIKSNGIGAFEIIFGLSGSGKTTFVNTLPKFFDGVTVIEFPKEQPTSNIILYIRSNYDPFDKNVKIFLIVGRDNPKSIDLEQFDDVMSDFVDFFRTSAGKCLVLWTVTKPNSAKTISVAAWDAGRNSVTNPETKGLYKFSGLEKEKYRSVADSTARSLTGDGLDGFGLSEKITTGLLRDADTIADFYEKLNTLSQKIRGGGNLVCTEGAD